MTNHLLLRSATHIALDYGTPERLRALGAENVISSRDCLVIGPSRRDPNEHERARRAFWNMPESERADLPYSAEIPTDRPVLIWVSASVPQRVKLWRACQWLKLAGFGATEVTVLDFPVAPPVRPREGPPPPINCDASVSDHTDDALSQRLEASSHVPSEWYEQAALLWDLYAAPDPSAFVERCQRGVDGFPELGPLWRLLSSFFPRRSSGGTLLLSRFDALLLGILSEEWRTPLNVFVHASPEGEDLRQLASCTGDLFIPRRLAHWSAHTATLAVEGEERPNPGRPMASALYRITEHGKKLRKEGLESLTDAPMLPVGGTDAYAPSSAWVVLDDGSLARWGLAPTH